MDIIHFAISNPVKVTVGVILIILFGALSLFTIPVQLVPDVDQPIITIETNWTGRSPEEVEQEILDEQEDKLKGVSNLKKMSSNASQGKAEITLEFYIGTNIDRAMQEVSDKLREVPEYPDDVDEPVISASEGSSENAIAWIILDSTDPEYDIQGFYDIADRRIKPYLERVEGLSRINLYGGREQQIHIRTDPHKLSQRGITYTDLRQALRAENLNVSAGDLPEGRLDVRIRTVGQYDAIDDIRRTIVAYREGGPVRVSDIADVVLTLEKRRSFVRANGKPAIAISAIRETGANVINVMLTLRERIAEVNERILPTYGNHLSLRQVYDETVYIYDAIELVSNNLWIGGAMAVCVLLLFLRTVRPTVIISLAIPVSLVGTFVVMAVFGRNVNVVSLAGLAFAVGMVVDNAIVVLENIDRHLNMGKTPVNAAYDAAKEVWGAVLASTLTTLAVFIPVLTIEEEAGQLFRDIALAICAAVSLSLIVSISVIPSASARWLKRKSTPSKTTIAIQSLFGLTKYLEKATQIVSNLVYWLVGPGVKRISIRVLVVVIICTSAIIAVFLLMPPTTYLPNGNRNLIFGIMLTPPAYNVEHSQYIGQRIEVGVRPYWEAKSIEESTAVGPVINYTTGQPYELVPPIDNYFFVTFGGTIFMGCTSTDKEIVKPLGPVLSGAMSGIPGSFGFAKQTSIFGRGLSGGNTVDVELYGTDLDRLRRSAQAFYMVLANRYGFDKVQPTPLNFNLAGPELQIKINQVKAKDLNLDVSAIGLTVQSLVDGAMVGDYRHQGQTIDILLTCHPDYPLSPDTMGQIPLATQPNGQSVTTVPLSAVTELSFVEAPQQINRIEQLRSVSFTVTPPDDVPLELASSQIIDIKRELQSDNQIASDIEVNLAGTADKLVQVRAALLGDWKGFDNLESWQNLLTSRLFLALLITFLLMAALFESFLYPFVIMFSVPLASVGGFLGLAIANAIDPSQQLDVLTMLGFVILIGVVVNNAILIVHQALNFTRGLGESGLASDEGKSEKLSPQNAIRESVRTRMRPVFMTTLTSVFGMIPMVIMPGSGSEIYKGLGSVVVGGLIVSTIFTLIVVPLVFSMAVDLRLSILRRINSQDTIDFNLI